MASVPIAATNATGATPKGAIPLAIYGLGTEDKAQIAALTAVTQANAVASVGVPTKAEFDAVVALANANKAAINAVIAALKA